MFRAFFLAILLEEHRSLSRRKLSTSVSLPILHVHTNRTGFSTSPQPLQNDSFFRQNPVLYVLKHLFLLLFLSFLSFFIASCLERHDPSIIDSEITQLRSSDRHNRNDNRDRTRQPDDHHDGDHYRLDDFERYRRPSPRSDRHRNDRLLSSMTHPTTIMTTKEKSSIRKPTIGNITLVMAVVADTTISSPPPENMLASLMKHQLSIATTAVDVLTTNQSRDCDSYDSDCDRSSNPSG